MREDYTRLMYQTAAVAADLVTYGMGAGGYKHQSYFVCSVLRLLQGVTSLDVIGSW